jgi:hypothetical protein
MLSSGMWRRVALVTTDVSEQSIEVFLGSVLQLIVTADVPNSLIIFTLMMEAIRSSETLVLTRASWRHIPEDGNVLSHCRENFKS